MNNQRIELTAYCGLYCGDCLRYRSKAADLARVLGKELEKLKFDKYAEVKKISMKEFEHYQECCQVLDAIAKLKCNTPCRAGGDGCLRPCEIKKCVQKKNFKGCWECNEMPRCKRFEFLKPFHGNTPQENLKKIKEYGLDEWVEQRAKFYSWL